MFTLVASRETHETETLKVNKQTCGRACPGMIKMPID